jgi:uncharacterized repeat protein (TIGR03803 family)
MWTQRIGENMSNGKNIPGQKKNSVCFAPSGDKAAARGRRRAGADSIGFLTEALERRTLMSVGITTLAAFNDANGISPESSLISDSSGNLYGTTRFGGANNLGTVFEIAAGTQTIATLVNFNGANGQHPLGTLIFDANGNLYGTTSDGGSGNGTVFELAAGTRALTTLVAFNGVNGQSPEGGLIADSSGNLYGTTYFGGGNSAHGTVYELAAGSHALSTLVDFNVANGANPIGSLIADNTGNLYGVTVYGSSFDDGTVFELAAGSHTLSTLDVFHGPDGQNPEGGLAFDLSGNLYGTTFRGGANSDGNVFKIASGSLTLSTVLDFNGINGQNPAANLIGDGVGNLYGTTSGGGTNNDGTIFKVVSGSNTFSTVTSFNDTNGAFPLGGLILDGDGNIYGTTSSGGVGNAGTVFKYGQNIGAAAKVVFAPEPVNALPAHPVSPGITVAVEDASGNVEINDTSSVTLSPASGPAGSLGGTLTATAVNGIATFANVTFSIPSAYTLTAKDGALSGATSSTFYVVPVTGYVDTASMNDITGWAADPSNPTASINVQIVISGGGPTQTFTANQNRSDLVSVLGSGNHAFNYSTPVLSVGNHTANIYAVLTNGTKVLIGTKNLVSQNSLFDEHYYLQTNPDVAAAVAAGVIATGYDHYIQYGQFEGRSPSPYWNEAYYLSQNADVATAVKNKVVTSGFMQYYLYGQYENRGGLLYFNNSYYLNTYPDVASAVTAKAVTSGFEHYVLYGQFEGRSPMKYFSSSYYDAANPDILPYVTGQPISSDYEQFVEYGQYEGRVASPFYNEQTYLADNPDVAAAVASKVFPDGFQHWLEYGQFEGRVAV